jgi:hypothetical protein
MTVVDSTTLEPVGPPFVPSVGFNPLGGVSMSADGARVAVSGPGGVEVIDVAVGRAPRPPIPIGAIESAPFSLQHVVGVALDDVAGRGAMLAEALADSDGPFTAAEKALGG